MELNQGSGLSSPRIGTRVMAKIVDLLVVIAVAAVLPYPLGPVLGFLYSVLGDGLPWRGRRGQSFGKKLFGLQVVAAKTKQPIGFRASVLRNAPVGVATFFAIIPVWGWLILGLVGVPLMIMEVYLMLTGDAAHRLGDVMADTEVVSIL